MKILRVIASMNPETGGPCEGIRNSISELKKLGIHNEVVCLDEPSSSFLGNDAFPIHPLGPKRGPWQYGSKLQPWLLKNLSRFDVVIVHGLWLYHGFAVWDAVQKLRKSTGKYNLKQSRGPRFFIMPHGMLDPYFQKASNRKLKAIRNWIYWKVIEGRVVNNAEGVLFTCAEELHLARKSFRSYYPKREINIGYGLENPPCFHMSMSEAFYEKCPFVAGRPYLLFLSRIHPKKGVDLLIKAYASHIKDNLKYNQRFPLLIIAGPGCKTPYGLKMQELVAENPQLRFNVFFPGMLTGMVKWGAIYGCEAFVLPSHQENFGIAVVEALACGKPVLISKQVNIWREIEGAGGGFVAEDTVEGVMALLERWERLSPAERQVMGQSAKDCFATNFTIAPVARKLLKAVSI
ncbi:glycosyltransferase [Chitinophagaceae bacterium LB-8]|uniref:Glycosyltransferase n=1 Tax=Paraflavisolibacter caeni TaxID=2982496 RepID=A0A9X2XSM1_9BACT|nr:glycosyltransferase [Paraflavisolibacter caeni]MCU7547502.1 glycosyltransferase [Paraflavisolibacter caeni]